MSKSDLRNTRSILARRWLPIALCCVPCVVVGLLGAGIGLFATGGRSIVEPRTLFLLVMGLACPIGMGVMLWLMSKNLSHPQEHLSSESNETGISAASRLAELREQRQILETEIAEMTRLVELEEQRDALLADPSSVPDDTPFSAAG